MRTFYLVSVTSDEVGEVQGFFEDGKLVHSWDCNDGNWRGEYFDPILEELGAEVIYSDDPKLEKKLVESHSY